MKALDLRACLIAVLFVAILSGCASASADATSQDDPAQTPAPTSIPF